MCPLPRVWKYATPQLSKLPTKRTAASAEFLSITEAGSFPFIDLNAARVARASDKSSIVASSAHSLTFLETTIKKS